MEYFEGFSRFTTTNALHDRETKRRFVSDSWVEIKTDNGHIYKGIILYIGSMYVILGIRPPATDEQGAVFRRTEKIKISTIQEVKGINALWEGEINYGN